MRTTSLMAVFVVSGLFHGPFASARTIEIAPGANVQERTQEALILAEPGDVVEFAEGTFEYTVSLSLDVDRVTIRGQGMDKTVLSFKHQDLGSEGLLITSDGVLCEDFAVEDSKGDCIKAKGCDGITIRRVRAEWTGGPNPRNGAYGLYPVESSNVLVEDCVAVGASDVGIYVGQSKNIIVRNNRTEYNVAGIEIENSYGADVYGNVATKNTGGILILDLPGLPQLGNRDIRVFQNEIYDNDIENFAPEGTIAAMIPRGTGLQVLASTNVHVFENDIRDNKSANVLILSYLATGIEIKDENYNPFPTKIAVYDNKLGKGGYDPQGVLKETMVPLAGEQLPDIIWDGIVAEGGGNPQIIVANNGDADFANVDLGRAMRDPKNAQVDRDLANYAGELPKLKPIEIAGVQ